MVTPGGVSRRIFFDANLIGVARVLGENDRRIIYPGHPDWPLSHDAPDEEWLRYVGERDWCAVLRDKRIRYRAPQRSVLETYQVRAAVTSTRRNLTIEENIARLKRFWDGIEEALARPPSYGHLTHSGLTTLLDYGRHGAGGRGKDEQR